MRAELLRRRRELLARVSGAILRIGDVAAMAPGEAEIHSHLGRVVELVGRDVVAEVVAAVAREPELARGRVPVEADAVPHAAREDLALPLGGVQAADRAVLALRLAHVARRADADVELPIGPEAKRPEPVVAIARQVVDDDRRLRRALEARLDVVVAQDARDLADVQRAVAERDAVRRLEI